jgi:phage tail sheath gpL-like
MATSERPGVYSSYEVSSAVGGRGGGGVVGIAAAASQGTEGKSYIINSYAEAASAFGADSSMARLIKLLFLNGASSVRAVPAAVGSAPDPAKYEAAFGTLMDLVQVKIMVCDSHDLAVHQAMKRAIETASEHSKYRIGVVEGSGGVQELVAAAGSLNFERMVLCAPAEASDMAQPGAVAAALAGLIASGTDPALPLNGAALYGLSGLASSFTDTDINALVQGGVTPIENVGGKISVIRGVTTRTTTAGVPDPTWRELTTTLIIDDVIPTIKNSLQSRFARSKNTAQTRGAIRTQVIIELENKLAREIIDSYDNVTVKASETDPATCEVSFDFTVAHGLNHIRLTAHITV